MADGMGQEALARQTLMNAFAKKKRDLTPEEQEAIESAGAAAPPPRSVSLGVRADAGKTAEPGVENLWGFDPSVQATEEGPPKPVDPVDPRLRDPKHWEMLQKSPAMDVDQEEEVSPAQRKRMMRQAMADEIMRQNLLRK